MFKGSIVALVTPMNEDGTLAEPALFKLIDWHIEQGSDALVIMGTTGESATLNEKEHCQVIKLACKHAKGRIPIIAGTGANATNEAITLTQCAKKAGADACLLVTPYYNKPTQEGLYLHYKAIAEAVDIPQILYNVPSRTACDLLPETISRLAPLKNIIGVKEATGDLSRLAMIKSLCPANFILLSGDDSSTRAFILAGGDGAISVTANVAPAKMHQMCQAALAFDAEKAAKIDAELILLHQHLFIQSSPIPVKWAIAEMGLMPKGIRLPLTWLEQQYEPPLKIAMQQAGVL